MEFVPSGFGNVNDYLISGVPYATSSTAPITTPGSITFPFITKQLIIKNDSSLANLVVGFTSNGTKNTNRFTLIPSESLTMDVRVKTVYLMSTGVSGIPFSMFASLTLINSRDFPILTGSLTQPTSSYNNELEYAGLG